MELCRCQEWYLTVWMTCVSQAPVRSVLFSQPPYRPSSAGCRVVGRRAPRMSFTSRWVISSIILCDKEIDSHAWSTQHGPTPRRRHCVGASVLWNRSASVGRSSWIFPRGQISLRSAGRQKNRKCKHCCSFIHFTASRQIAAKGAQLWQSDRFISSASLFCVTGTPTTHQINRKREKRHLLVHWFVCCCISTSYTHLMVTVALFCRQYMHAYT